VSSHKRKLLAAYENLLETQAAMESILPPRLATLVADPEWIAAVAARNEAHERFIKAARATCETWRKQKEKLASAGSDLADADS